MTTFNVDGPISFGKALKVAQAGDTIALAAGVYTGLRITELKTTGLTITSQDPGRPAVLKDLLINNAKGLTFTGLEFVVDASKGDVPFKIAQSSNIVFDHLKVHGSLDGNAANDVNAFAVYKSTGVVLSNSEIQQVKNVVLQSAEDQTTLTGNDVHDITGVAVKVITETSKPSTSATVDGKTPTTKPPETERPATSAPPATGTEPTKTEPPKTEPTKTEPVKTETPQAGVSTPTKDQPTAGTEPTKAEPTKTEPTKAEPAKTDHPETGGSTETKDQPVTGTVPTKTPPADAPPETGKSADTDQAPTAGSKTPEAASTIKVIAATEKGGRLDGTAGDDLMKGGKGADEFHGGAGNDYLLGAAGNDALYGDAGNDTLSGADGSDILAGGSGINTLLGGGGADVFVFKTGDFEGGVSKNRTTISDFSHAQGDKIDLTGLDAIAGTAADDAFTLIGSQGFHKLAGELRYEVSERNVTLLGDTNGDGVADLVILLSNAAGSVTPGDVLL